MSEDDEMTEVRRRSLHWLTAQEEKGELNEGQRTRLNQLRQEFAHIPTQPRGEAQERQEYKEKPRSFTDRLFGSSEERAQKNKWRQEEKEAYEQAHHKYRIMAVQHKAKKDAFAGGGGLLGGLGREVGKMSMASAQNVFNLGVTPQRRERPSYRYVYDKHGRRHKVAVKRKEKRGGGGAFGQPDWGAYEGNVRGRGDLSDYAF